LSLASGMVAHYRLIEKLGAGGMGVVYLAEDTKLGRQVALKVLPPEAASDPARLERFQREARAVAALNHPHIVTLYSVEEAGGVHFLTMEHVEGQSLDRLIPEGGLPLKRLLEIAVALADALAAAHDKGIVHRDLKPANVVIGEKGVAKVLDFGLAKLSQAPARADVDSELSTQARTREGVVMGTVPYMSPEQVSGRPLDHRTDLFSLGVMLYEMASGDRPFQGKSSAELASSILRDMPANLMELKAELPPDLARIVQRCLEKDPERRYRSARGLHDELAALRDEMASGGRPSAAPRAASAAGPAAWSRAHWKGAAVTAAVLIVAAMAVTRFRGGDARAVDSIAILPFVNGDANPDTDYLADGISESISNNLSQIQSLRVMAQDSVRRYKGRQGEARAIGKELAVRAVLTGTVTSRGEMLRIQAELIDIRTGAKLWGQQLTRRQGEVLELQDDIARHISGRLEIRLSGAERKQVARRDTADQGAYQRYLRGRYHWNERTSEGYRKAIEFFREAIELDPSYARAYVGLADSYAFLEVEGVPARDRYQKAIGIVKKALEIDDGLGEAHASMALLIHDRDWDLAGAEREYRRAIELSPNYASAQHWYGEFLVQKGRFDEAFEHYRRALEVDPLSSAISSDLGISLYYARHYDRAVAELQRTIQADPKFSRTHQYLARVYAQVGRYREAVDEHQKGWLLAGDNPDAVAQRTEAIREALARSGAQGFWRKRLELELQKTAGDTDWALDVAMLYARLGEKDQAFSWLERAYADRVFELLFLKVGPEWDNLRDDPRFESLLRRIGLAG
jgi:eukaryotic-like serine/threonine-protein kinase